jgi:hypothetical protein
MDDAYTWLEDGVMDPSEGTRARGSPRTSRPDASDKRRAPGPPFDEGSLGRTTGASSTVGHGRRRLAIARPQRLAIRSAERIWYSVLLSTGTPSYYLVVLSVTE